MKLVKIFLITMAISFSAFADNNDCNDRGPRPSPGSGHEDRGDRGGRDDRGGREDKVSSQCSLSQISCGSSDGSQGNIPSCSIKCYRNATAVCSPGKFSWTGCEVVDSNSCDCQGGY
jgi:hypothetical protein